jgi:(2Fe-2S) ferredoxin
MEKPTNHIFVCGSFRASGEPQGACHKKGSLDYLAYIESELADRGLTGVNVSATGCLKACDRGPVMVIYPENLWYGGVESEDIIDKILDALEDGSPAEEYLLT